MLVDDVALELRGWNDFAMTEFEVFDKEACAVEGLLATNARELLIDFVVKLNVTL